MLLVILCDSAQASVRRISCLCLLFSTPFTFRTFIFPYLIRDGPCPIPFVLSFLPYHEHVPHLSKVFTPHSKQHKSKHQHSINLISESDASNIDDSNSDISGVDPLMEALLPDAGVEGIMEVSGVMKCS